MAKRKVSVLILCEDQQHESFVREYVKRVHDVRNRGIRTIASTKGKGSAFQFVMDNFPTEVYALRKRGREHKLIAVVDADNKSVEERMDQLSKSLKAEDTRGDSGI